MVPLAFGTQTVGSVIRPAAFCGCIGYKPKAGAKVSDFDLGEPFEHFEAMGRRINDYESSRALKLS